MKENLFPLRINSRKVVFIPAFFLLSCTNPPANKNENNVRQIASFQKEKPSETIGSFPINYIIQNSRERKLYSDLSKINRSELKRIKSSFFKKWFDKTPVNISENQQVIFCFSPDDSYYFFDYMDSGSVFFCSIIEYLDNNETFRMYHFTIDKQRQVILHADWIAVQSSKNSYRVNDRMNYNSKGNKLIVNSTIIGDFHNFRGRMQSVREIFCFSLAGTTRKTLKR